MTQNEGSKPLARRTTCHTIHKHGTPRIRHPCKALSAAHLDKVWRPSHKHLPKWWRSRCADANWHPDVLPILHVRFLFNYPLLLTVWCRVAERMEGNVGVDLMLSSVDKIQPNVFLMEQISCQNLHTIYRFSWTHNDHNVLFHPVCGASLNTWPGKSWQENVHYVLWSGVEALVDIQYNNYGFLHYHITSLQAGWTVFGIFEHVRVVSGLGLNCKNTATNCAIFVCWSMRTQSG